MNRFGKNIRLQIFGESHGPYVGITIDGCPAGISLQPDDFESDLQRRRGGMIPGTTPRSETDTPIIISGWFNGFTTGTPLTILFENADTRSQDYEKQKNLPRPGHADWVSAVKFKGYQDYRGGGHFSGRLTACLVAGGVIGQKILDRLTVSGKSISCRSRIVEIGGLPSAEEGIKKAMELGDSVGGIVECSVTGIPPGLGEPFFDSMESLISHAVFSIPAIKGIEFGSGFAAARMTGSEHNDALLNAAGQTSTNHAGGISGGISNGNELLYRVAVKPTSSTPKAQQTVNMETGNQETLAVKGRHDLCIALRVPVVLEAVTKLVLADLFLENHMHQ